MSSAHPQVDGPRRLFPRVLKQVNPHDYMSRLRACDQDSKTVVAVTKTYTRSIDTPRCTRSEACLPGQNLSGTTHVNAPYPPRSSDPKDPSQPYNHSLPCVKPGDKQAKQAEAQDNGSPRSQTHRPLPTHITLLVAYKSFALCSCNVLH